MKVVLDTNIIIAAFSTHGLCNAVFELCLDRCDIYASDFILNEVKSVFKEKYKIPDREIQSALDYLGDYCFVTLYPKLPGRVCRD
jgi:predicted nucleic acid-binding protein